ncbi:MAG: hypothetical protein D6770_03070 [Anaerolineae bacterium]|nr:MAG: hypothetical protein D6770_03070 [Anaerolineae bacterium]
MTGVQIGEVTHYFNKIGVAVIALSGEIKIGDKVHFLGHSTDFMQEVTSMQIEHRPIQEGKPGEEIAIKVKQRVRRKDRVYKLTEDET